LELGLKDVNIYELWYAGLVLHQDLGASLLKTLICASSSMRLLTIVSFGILILTCTAQATLKRYPIMEYHYFSYFFLF